MKYLRLKQNNRLLSRLLYIYISVAIFVDGSLQLRKGFLVSLHQTTSRSQQNLTGKLFLEVTASYVILHQLDGKGRQVIQWPLVHIRKFKCEDKERPNEALVTLEASW